MTESFEMAKMKLVTVICSFHLADGIVSQLRALGVKGYTRSKADGWGSHGTRTAGLIDSANVRIDTLVEPELAPTVLHAIANSHAGNVVAFAVDAEVVAGTRFGGPAPE
jgi:nitrogen regulatory protein PII